MSISILRLSTRALMFGLVFLFCTFVALFAAGAQEQTTTAVTADTAATASVSQDATVTAADLGVADPRVLPGNPLYFFKSFGRAVNLAFTFDPIRKVEKQLQIANSKLIEAQKVMEEKGAEEAKRVVGDAVEAYHNDVVKIAARADQLREEKKDSAPRVNQFLDTFAAQTIKQEIVLANIEEHAPQEVFAQVKEARRDALQNFGEVMQKVGENNAQIATRMTKAFADRTGSEFKDFNNLQIIQAFEREMPEDVRAAVQTMKQDTAKRVEKIIQQKGEAFKKYVENDGGDPTGQLAALDEVSRSSGATDQSSADIEVLREKTSKKFEEQFRAFTDETAQKSFIQHLQEGRPEDIRIIKQIEKIVDPEVAERMKQADMKAVEKFKERFSNDPEALKKADLFKQARENPDSVDFEVLQAIEKTLTPAQKEFVQGVKQDLGERFQEKFQQQGERFLKQFTTNDPRQIDVLKELRTFVPEQAMQGIDQAIQVQTEKVQQHLQQLNDPAVFEKFRSAIQDGSAIQQEFEQRTQNIFGQMQQKEQGLKDAIRAQFVGQGGAVPSPDALDFRKTFEGMQKRVDDAQVSGRPLPSLTPQQQFPSRENMNRPGGEQEERPSQVPEGVLPTVPIRNQDAPRPAFEGGQGFGQESERPLLQKTENRPNEQGAAFPMQQQEQMKRDAERALETTKQQQKQTLPQPLQDPRAALEKAKQQLNEKKVEMKDRIEERKEVFQEKVQEHKDNLQERAEERKEVLQERLQDRKDAVQERKEEIKDAIQIRVENAEVRRDAVKDQAEERREQVGDAAETANDLLKKQAEQVREQQKQELPKPIEQRQPETQVRPETQQQQQQVQPQPQPQFQPQQPNSVIQPQQQVQPRQQFQPQQPTSPAGGQPQQQPGPSAGSGFNGPGSGGPSPAGGPGFVRP